MLSTWIFDAYTFPNYPQAKGYHIGSFYKSYKTSITIHTKLDFIGYLLKNGCVTLLDPTCTVREFIGNSNSILGFKNNQLMVKSSAYLVITTKHEVESLFYGSFSTS